MPAIHVRNVPEPVLAALRERAGRHSRSMQAEVRQILAEAASAPVTPEAVPPVQLNTVRTSVTSAWRREEIYGDAGR